MSKEAGNFEEMKSSRRDFIRKAGTIGASMLVVPYLKPSGILAYDLRKNSSYLATVAVTNTTNTRPTATPMMIPTAVSNRR
jgi:hypothetical protein